MGVGVYSKVRPAQPQEQKKGPRVYRAESTKSWQVPYVKSKVKDLRIVAVSVSDEGTPAAALQIGVMNNSDRAVVAVEFSAGDATDKSNLGIDGQDADPDNPTVVIEPHTLRTFTWSLNSILEGKPISLVAAKFADGKEEGDDEALQLMRKDFARAKKGGRQ